MKKSGLMCSVRGSQATYNHEHNNLNKFAILVSITAMFCMSSCSDDSGSRNEPAVQDQFCGDGILDKGESCDKGDLGGKICQNWAEYIGGTLACNASCEFDKSGCYECTDTDLSRCSGEQTCLNGHCTDPGHVVSCGDNLAEGVEECDGSDLRYKTCKDFDGFTDGMLKCSNCQYDKSECVGQAASCGNNQADGNEECDGTDLKGKTCADFNGYADGTLKCSQCAFDTSECVECTEDNLSMCADGQECPNGRCVDPGHVTSCGDNLAENSEACDGSDLKGKSCANFEGFNDGTLKCSECSYDTSECLECSTEAHCAGRTDGKTHCESNVCVKPADMPTPITSPKVVISQIYTGGGNSKAIYNTKYIELLNTSDKTVDISNWSIQYGSSKNDTVAGTCILPNSASIPKGGYYLIALQTGSNGTDIITPDFTCGSLNPAAANGKLFLVGSSENLDTSSPDSGYVDAIGYGNANWAEGGNPVAALSSKTAAFRKNGGCLDTDNNGNDFDIDAPSPRNSKSPVNLCNGTQPQPTDTCGNGKLDDDEDCDGNLFLGNDSSCQGWMSIFESGNVKCDRCKISFDECSLWKESVCGNNNLEEEEDCDGNLFAMNNNNCRFWDSAYTNGTVTCKKCSIDYSECSSCGNGKLEADEACDGKLFKGNKTSCQSWDSRYSGGNVSCYKCEIDYSNCKTPPTCGNGNIDSGEQCDGNVFSGNKTTCESWDSTYNSGNVSCNSCKIDYTNCQKKPVCGNNKLENGEDCDGKLFKDDKTACADWDKKYNRGSVTCNKCEINYSKCGYMGASSCLTGQEWSSKYDTCVYPIRSESDWNTYVSNWNSQCSGAYPNGADKTAFLLKADISLNNPLPWGGDGCPLEANFYGDNHTITLTADKKGRRLFGYINQSNIKDLTVKLVATQYAESLFARNVRLSSLSNITMNGSWNYKGDEDACITFYEAYSSTFEKITLDINGRFEPAKASADMSLLVNNSKSSKYNGILLKGNYNVQSADHNDYNGLVFESSGDSFNRCEMDMELTVRNIYPPSKEQWTSLIARTLKAGTTFSKLNIKRLDVHRSTGTEVTLVWDSEMSNAGRLYDIEDNTRLLMIDSNTEYNESSQFLSGEEYVYNSVFNSNFAIYNRAGFYNSMNNVIFSKKTSRPYKANYATMGSSLKNIYIKEDIENASVTPYLLNNNAKSIPSTYGNPDTVGLLPWKQNSDGSFHLRFDAKDDELL